MLVEASKSSILPREQKKGDDVNGRILTKIGRTQ